MDNLILALYDLSHNNRKKCFLIDRIFRERLNKGVFSRKMPFIPAFFCRKPDLYSVSLDKTYLRSISLSAAEESYIACIILEVMTNLSM